MLIKLCSIYKSLYYSRHLLENASLSLAYFSNETLFLYTHQKWGCNFSAERSKLNKDPHLSQRHPLFCEENLGNIDPNDIYRLKALITNENFEGQPINWSGVVNVHCLQMSLIMNKIRKGRKQIWGRFSNP